MRNEMETEIWKYILKDQSAQLIKMPSGYEILTVQVQESITCIWVRVIPKNTKVLVSIEIYGTGFIIPSENGRDRRYIGTYQMNDGSLIFHVFEDRSI